jgi:hypothetical protein
MLYLLSSYFKLLSPNPSYFFNPPIQNAALSQSLVLTHSRYNITDVIAQLISVLKMEAAVSSTMWVIVHQST